MRDAVLQRRTVTCRGGASENDINKQDKGEERALQPELPDANVCVHAGHTNGQC